MTEMTGIDEEIERRLRVVRQMLHSGTTLAPNLREVYFAANRAYAAIRTGDLADAYWAARNARATLTGAAIDVVALEGFLGTHDGGETIDDFVRAVSAELDHAVDALASGSRALRSTEP